MSTFILIGGCYVDSRDFKAHLHCSQSKGDIESWGKVDQNGGVDEAVQSFLDEHHITPSLVVRARIVDQEMIEKIMPKFCERNYLNYKIYSDGED